MKNIKNDTYAINAPIPERLQKIKSALVCLSLLLCGIFGMTAFVSLGYPLVVYAASDASASMTFMAESKEDDEYYYDCSDEYVVLNQDHTGMVVADRCAYTIEWSLDGDNLVWTDHMDYKFEGTMTDENTIQGNYRSNLYTYVLSDEAAPIMSLSPESWGESLGYVTDEADILTDDEEAKLSAQAKEISEKYQCAVYIVTLDDMRNFTKSYSIETCAEEIRAGYNLGYGSGHDLVMLVLSMSERDYDLMTFGDFGNESFTDYGKDRVEEKFLDDFADDEWYNGFADYLSQCDRLLKLSSEGKPLDVGTSPAYTVVAILASLVIGFIIALIICGIIRGTMRKTSEKSDAANYVLQNGVHIVHRQDLFMRTSETRVYDPPEKSDGGGGGGGGGTSTSSSGSSHSSGKF